jgi:hypothetical protein
MQFVGLSACRSTLSAHPRGSVLSKEHRLRRLCTLTLEIQIALCPTGRVHLIKGEGERGDRCSKDVCRSVQ